MTAALFQVLLAACAGPSAAIRASNFPGPPGGGGNFNPNFGGGNFGGQQQNPKESIGPGGQFVMPGMPGGGNQPQGGNGGMPQHNPLPVHNPLPMGGGGGVMGNFMPGPMNNPAMMNPGMNNPGMINPAMLAMFANMNMQNGMQPGNNMHMVPPNRMNNNMGMGMPMGPPNHPMNNFPNVMPNIIPGQPNPMNSVPNPPGNHIQAPGSGHNQNQHQPIQAPGSGQNQPIHPPGSGNQIQPPGQGFPRVGSEQLQTFRDVVSAVPFLFAAIIVAVLFGLVQSIRPPGQNVLPTNLNETENGNLTFAEQQVEKKQVQVKQWWHEVDGKWQAVPSHLHEQLSKSYAAWAMDENSVGAFDIEMNNQKYSINFNIRDSELTNKATNAETGLQCGQKPKDRSSPVQKPQDPQFVQKKSDYAKSLKDFVAKQPQQQQQQTYQQPQQNIMAFSQQHFQRQGSQVQSSRTRQTWTYECSNGDWKTMKDDLDKKLSEAFDAWQKGGEPKVYHGDHVYDFNVMKQTNKDSQRHRNIKTTQASTKASLQAAKVDWQFQSEGKWWDYASDADKAITQAYQNYHSAVKSGQPGKSVIKIKSVYGEWEVDVVNLTQKNLKNMGNVRAIRIMAGSKLL